MKNDSNEWQSDNPNIIANPIPRIIAVALAILNAIWIIPFGIFIILPKATELVYLLKNDRKYFDSRLSTMFATTHGIYYFFYEHILPYLIFIIGCLMLAGYICRAFDKLSKKLRIGLWVTQIFISLFVLYVMLMIALGRGFVDSFDFIITALGILIFILPTIALIKDFLLKGKTFQ